METAFSEKGSNPKYEEPRVKFAVMNALRIS